MEIEKQEFGRQMRGYDTSQVHLFLQSVADEVERLNLENGELRDEVGRLRGELQELRSRERTLQETLVTAQQMSGELKDRAGKEGELVVREARLKAEKLLRDAQDRLLRLEADISRSKLERESFEHRLRSVIDQHLTLLEMRREARGEMDNLRVLSDTETG
jgi:cell division initiation protein